MRSRITSIDVVRGIVMVIMTLDHVRDYFTNVRFNPSDLTQTTPALFFTRWITHFCAPVFVLLAGAGAFFYGQKISSTRTLSRFLWTRGLVLVVLEFTLIRWAFMFNFSYNFIIAVVIWVIGISMICLAALVYLPKKWIAFIGILMIVGHNTLDSISPQAFGSFGWLWMFLHVQSLLPLSSDVQVLIAYPLIPWIGVMATGYAFGSLYLLEPERRRRLFIQLGIALILAFVLVRGSNVYGDLRPWSTQKTPLYTFLSFLNATKQPPSLSFLLMTLGPAILLLGLLDGKTSRIGQFFTVYGKVPLFYFVAHFYLLHALSVVAGVWQGFPAKDFFQFASFYPQQYGFGLAGVYLAWAIVVLALYPACKWYGRLKAKSSNPILSYL